MADWINTDQSARSEHLSRIEPSELDVVNTKYSLHFLIRKLDCVFSTCMYLMTLFGFNYLQLVVGNTVYHVINILSPLY